MTAIVTTPNETNGSITVAVEAIPEGYEYASIFRTIDGVQTTLLDRGPVVGGRVEVVDYAAPPGWTITYSATVTSARGSNLAVNPSVELGDTGWTSSGTTRKVREDGSAHSGARYYRANGSAGSTMITPAIAAVVPGALTAADFENVDVATTTSVVADSTDDYVRSQATNVTPTISVAYSAFLTPLAPGGQVYSRVIYRTSALGPPPGGYVLIRIRWYNAAGTLLGSGTIGNGGLTTAWTVLQGTSPTAPANTAKCKLVVEVTRPFGEISYSINSQLDVAYFQAWPGTVLPTGGSFFYQQVPCTPGLTYSAEVWFRKGSPLPVNYVRVDTSFRDAADVVLGSTVVGIATVPPSQWELIKSLPAIAPANAATVRILIRGTFNDTNTVNPQPGVSYDLDDLYITDSQPLTITPEPVNDSLPARYLGEAWLKNPNDPDHAMPIMVEEQPSLSRAGQVGLHQVSGRARPVAVTDVRQSETGELSLLSTSAAERDRLLTLLKPGSVLLFQTTPEALLPPEMYMVISEATEERLTRLVGESWRRHSLAFTVVDPPGRALVSIPNTYQDLKTYGVTYQNVLNTRLTYLAVLNTSFNPSPPIGGWQGAVGI